MQENDLQLDLYWRNILFIKRVSHLIGLEHTFHKLQNNCGKILSGLLIFIVFDVKTLKEMSHRTYPDQPGFWRDFLEPKAL